MDLKKYIDTTTIDPMLVKVHILNSDLTLQFRGYFLLAELHIPDSSGYSVHAHAPCHSS